MTYGAQITPTAGTAAPTDHHVLHAAIAMGPHVRAAANEIERERRLPQSVVSEMKSAGIFGMAMPRAWGGPEVDPLTQLRIIEALAMADGSVGWCSMINCDGGYVTAFLDQEVARMMYSDIDVATAAPVSPTGQAVRVPGGFRVSGRFPFASGSLHCDWAWVGCVVVENGKPRINDNGVPETRQCLLEMSRCKIEDTWYTTGLRGTGSNDLFVTDQFVEEARSFSFQDPALVKRRGALYAYPFMFAAKGAAPALGIARHALDALIDRASSTSTRRYVVGNGIEPVKLMRDDVCVQEAVARADTMLMAARSHYFSVMGDLWNTLVEGRSPEQIQVARVTMAVNHVIGACVEAVQLACKAAGGRAVYEKGPFDRCLRDIMTVNQHLVASLRTYEMAGRLLLGLEPLAWLI